MSQHKIECWWLEKANTPELVKCDLFGDLVSKVITIKRLFKDDFVIKEEEIAELRTGLWTDTWINAKPLGELIANADISENECNYRSIVYKATQRGLPGKTVDLILLHETVESLDNLLSEMISNNEQSQVNLVNKNIDNTKVKIVDEIFSRYSEGKEFLSIQKLQTFLFKEQRIIKSKTECEELAAGCDKENEFLTVKGFRQFFNKHFGLFNSEHQDPVNQPMTNYFIASSHNSYLSGGQWFGNSSCEMYRNILLDGCRCIEIDVFYRDDRLTVMHGGAGTSKIALEDVLLTINEYAFVKSDYPLILSIENHLPDVVHENAMAQMLRNKLVGLYTENIENTYKFAPLDTMKRRIFIKCKRAKPTDKFKKQTETILGPIKKTFYSDTMSDQQNDKEDKVTESRNNGDLGYEDSDDDENISDDDEEDEEDEDDEDDEETEELDINDGQSNLEVACGSNERQIYSDCIKPNKREKVEVEEDKEREFLDLINYFEAKQFERIDDLENQKNFKFYHMISCSEKKSKKLWMNNQNRKKYQKFTQTHMARVYPRPIKLRKLHKPSHNYRPIGHWNAGAQMVSLNYQTVASEMAINWAMFELNKRCGYVLKPKYLLDTSTEPVPKNLQIQILGGSFGNLFNDEKEIKLTVTTRVYAPEDDNNKRRTYWKDEKKSNESSNGINPEWNGCMSYKLSNPELSFVQFSLKNLNKYVGHYMISYKAMHDGYRWLDLVDKNYLPHTFARIYVHVDKEYTVVRNKKNNLV